MRDPYEILTPQQSAFYILSLILKSFGTVDKSLLLKISLGLLIFNKLLWSYRKLYQT